MVKAATDIVYNNQFFKEGTELPSDLAKLFELKNPSLLDSYIEINGKWQRIDSPTLKGFVQERKNFELRLKKYFKPIQTVEIQKFTEKELFVMKKIEQVEILKLYGISEIPSLEKDRVKLILNLQNK